MMCVRSLLRDFVSSFVVSAVSSVGISLVMHGVISLVIS